MANQCIHYWLIDNKDVGRCWHCGAVQDFGALLHKTERKAVSLAKSAAAKERWEDPEYQAKQSAAIKKCWEDPEYQAKQSAARIR
ncbi:hypothetical protein ES703_15049 [subsurface metagenome]